MARQVLTAATTATTLLAVFSLAVAVATASSSGFDLSMVSSLPGQGVASRVAACILWLGQGLAGLTGQQVSGSGVGVLGVDAAAGIWRGTVWGLLAAGLAGVNNLLTGLEAKFYTGEYPPLRNTDKD
eukprot:jgi/Chrzof1/4766/Cz14g25140.t1